MSDATSDAIVVGAGIGGLSAAIALASEGLEVTVVEAADQPGGKAGVTVIDGVEVDTGPSVLTLPHVFSELLALAGMRMEDEVGLVRPTPAFRYVYPDGVVLDLHHDLEATLASVAATLGPDEADELARFLDYAGSIWRSAAPHFVYAEAPRLGNMIFGGLGRLGAVARIDPFRQMQAAIDKRVRSPHLRMLLARYATYNGSDVRRAPATLNCIAHVELALGGYGVEGGIYQLVRVLVRACERLGVDLRFGEPVARVLVTEAGVAGVELKSGACLSAPRVVANADAAQVVERLLPEGLRHGISLDGEPSMSGHNLILRAERAVGGSRRAAHTVLFPRDYDQEFADIFDGDRPPRDPTVYLCAQEVCHGRQGWADAEPVFVMANAPAEPHRGSRDDEVYDALRRRVVERLRASGLMAAGDEVLWERRPRELARRFVGSRGSIYGAASNGATAAFRRPANEVSGVPGLFLASGSAHPGGGLPLAALSGRAAARAALRTN